MTQNAFFKELLGGSGGIKELPSDHEGRITQDNSQQPGVMEMGKEGAPHDARAYRTWHKVILLEIRTCNRPLLDSGAAVILVQYSDSLYTDVFINTRYDKTNNNQKEPSKDNGPKVFEK